MLLLVISQDHREYLWKPWLKHFVASGWDATPVILTEQKKPDFVQSIQGGAQKKFTDWLKAALRKIEDEYIWLTLDDYFIIEPIKFGLYENMADFRGVDVLRVQPNVQYNSVPYHFVRGGTAPEPDKGLDNNVSAFYRFLPEGGLLRQTPDSAYMTSFQTSIYRREYLIDSLPDGMNPWEAETCTPENFGRVYFVPGLPFWYRDVVRRGKVIPQHAKLVYDT